MTLSFCLKKCANLVMTSLSFLIVIFLGVPVSQTTGFDCAVKGILLTAMVIMFY